MINDLYHFTDGASNKIWGWTKTADGALSFWGRAKGSMAFKRYDSQWAADQQCRRKVGKGYYYVHPNAQAALLPSDFEGQLMLAKLGMTKF